MLVQVTATGAAAKRMYAVPLRSVTSATSTTLVDSGATFDAGVLGRKVHIVAGTGQGQSRLVTAQTATQLTVQYAWDIIPDTSSKYEVRDGGALLLKSLAFSPGTTNGSAVIRDGSGGDNLITLTALANTEAVWKSENGVYFSNSIYVQTLSGTGPTLAVEYTI